MNVEPSSLKEDEFQLYKKYQVAVHGDKPDEVTRRGYDRFLCTSSLVQERPPADGPSALPLKGLGSFHIRYELDGKLIAVSVVDVLPSGMSSVYFFYDTDHAQLSLGVESALREIELVASETKRCPDFKYFYLGFYIHSCRKMRYKAQFEPSELLCPVTHGWAPASIVLPKLDRDKYCQFRDDLSPDDSVGAYGGLERDDKLLFGVNGQLITARGLFAQVPGLRLTEQSRKNIVDFHRLAGHDNALKFVHMLSLGDDFDMARKSSGLGESGHAAAEAASRGADDEDNEDDEQDEDDSDSWMDEDDYAFVQQAEGAGDGDDGMVEEAEDDEDDEAK